MTAEYLEPSQAKQTTTLETPAVSKVGQSQASRSRICFVWHYQFEPNFSTQNGNLLVLVKVSMAFYQGQ